MMMCIVYYEINRKGDYCKPALSILVAGGSELMSDGCIDGELPCANALERWLSIFWVPHGIVDRVPK